MHKQHTHPNTHTHKHTHKHTHTLLNAVKYVLIVNMKGFRIDLRDTALSGIFEGIPIGQPR